jgi:hypothetical protein
VKAVAERYEVRYCDRRDPLTSWAASRKIAQVLSTWIVKSFDGPIRTRFDLGGHQSIHELLADSAQFHRVVMQAAGIFHKKPFQQR